MRRRTFLAGLGFAALQLAGCGAKPQTAPDYVLTYADNQPAGYPTTQGAQYFADLVQQQTGGKVVIQVKANGEYGSEQQVWEQLAIGGVDFARVSLSVATDDLPRLNVLLLPYLYRDADHMWRVLDGSIGAEFLQDFTAQGRVGLSWYDAGARSFYARQPVHSLNDLQGKTIRVQDSQIVIDMIRLLGAVPETTAYSDVYSALETGQIDAAENNWPAYYSMEHYKVARYYMADEHSRVPEVQLASGRTWDALPEEYQQILQTAASNCRCPKRKCRTSGSWYSRCTGNTVPTICRWWKRSRQSDSRDRDESNKRAHSFEVILDKGYCLTNIPRLRRGIFVVILLQNICAFSSERRKCGNRLI